MNLSKAGLELLKRSEGFRGRVYTDIAGLRTIGFGHRVRPDEDFVQPLNLAQGEALLAEDVASTVAVVAHYVRVPLTQGQFDALVDFIFNLGAGRLASSTLLQYLNAGKYNAAAWQLLAWDHAGAKEIAGLKARREAEFNLWMAQAG
jgi:lysozyme